MSYEIYMTGRCADQFIGRYNDYADMLEHIEMLQKVNPGREFYFAKEED